MLVPTSEPTSFAEMVARRKERLERMNGAGLQQVHKEERRERKLAEAIQREIEEQKQAERAAAERLAAQINYANQLLQHPLWNADNNDPAPIRLQTIVKAVARHFGVSRIDIISARRTAKLIRPRHIVCYLARELTTLSLPAISERIGGRDHTTALHAIRKITSLIERDPQLVADIAAIKLQLGIAE